MYEKKGGRHGDVKDSDYRMDTTVGEDYIYIGG